MNARKRPEDLRSHRWLGVNDLRAFGHRSRLRQGGYDATDDNADAKAEAMAGAKEDVAENQLEESIRTMKKSEAKAPAKPKSAKKKP